MLVEPTHHIFQLNGKQFIAKIVGSFCGDNWRRNVKRSDFTVFLVDGNDEILTANWTQQVDKYYIINSDYLVGRATPLMVALC